MAYQLALPPEIEKINDVFYVSQPRKYVPHPSHILSYSPPLIQEDLSYMEESAQLHHKIKSLRNKTIPLVKVLWRSQKFEEATWESE